jgi:hypothetical protein
MAITAAAVRVMEEVAVEVVVAEAAVAVVVVVAVVIPVAVAVAVVVGVVIWLLRGWGLVQRVVAAGAIVTQQAQPALHASDQPRVAHAAVMVELMTQPRDQQNASRPAACRHRPPQPVAVLTKC